MKEISQICEECQWQREQQTLCNSDNAINQNFDLKTPENEDCSDQELLYVDEDEDEGDNNEKSDKDAPAENQSQVPQNAIHWSSMRPEIDVEKFFTLTLSNQKPWR